MSKFQGFFELATPPDLLKKLRHDLSRVQQNLTDSYAAFDFFVTAEHILDWKYPDTGGNVNMQRRTTLRKTVLYDGRLTAVCNKDYIYPLDAKHPTAVDTR